MKSTSASPGNIWRLLIVVWCTEGAERNSPNQSLRFSRCALHLSTFRHLPGVLGAGMNLFSSMTRVKTYLLFLQILPAQHVHP